MLATTELHRAVHRVQWQRPLNVSQPKREQRR